MAKPIDIPLVPPIVLVGPPGAGKSTLAPSLAKALGMTAIDLDREVDAEHLLRADGVGALRVAEYVALKQHLSGAVVIAAGGGIVDTPHSRALLQRALVIYLDVEVSVCLNRIEGTERSWLPPPGDPSRIAAYQQREQGRHHHRQQLAAITMNGDDETSRLVDALAAAVRRQPVGAVWHHRPHSHPGGKEFLPGEFPEGAPGGKEFLQPDGFAVIEAAVAAAHPEVRADLVIDTDASGKTLALAERIATSWLASKRGGPLVAIGGGTLLDVAGLAAALTHRGRPWLAVPTTLLAMVDAAVGGKTAVDAHIDGPASARSKNQLGVFHPPQQVVVWPGFLSTLDDHLIRHGRAEMAKHALLGGPDMDSDPAAHRDFKAAVVAIDTHDVHFRQALNAGHTIGHALEVVAQLPHGDAVWWGLHTELAYAVAYHGAPNEPLMALEGRMAEAEVPALPPLSAKHEQLMEALRNDKKGSRCALLGGNGSAKIAHLDDDDHRNMLQLLHQPLAFR